MGINLQDFDVSDEDYKQAKKAAINGDKEYITKDQVMSLMIHFTGSCGVRCAHIA